MMTRKTVTRTLLCLLFLLLAAVSFLAWTLLTVPSQRAARTFPDTATRYDFGRVLVVYYSLGGNTAEVAARIGEMTGGTLFEITTEEAYPSTRKLFWVAWQELKNRDFPRLRTPMPNLDSYDVIFVGSPVWWHSVAPPVLSFITRNNFKDKTIVPFCTQGGNFGNFFNQFQDEIQKAKIAKGMAFSGVEKTDVSALDAKISDWLKELQNELNL